LSENEESSGNCPQCGNSLSKAKKIAFNPPEIPMSDCSYNKDNVYNEMGLSEKNDLLNSYNFRPVFEDRLISNHDLQTWLDKEDPMIAKIIELVCLHDYSIHEAATEVGISGPWAYIKLRQLKNKRIVREIFNRG